MVALEQVFGTLKYGMQNPNVLPMRRLERLLFRAWCNWLCRPPMFPGQDKDSRHKFIQVVQQVEEAIAHITNTENSDIYDVLT